MAKLILNKRWVFFVTLFAILIAIGISTLDEELWRSIALIAVGGLLLLGYIFVFPNSYRFDENAITIYYGFGMKTVAVWNELQSIEDHHSGYGMFSWFREYHIGYFKTKFPLWEKACIPKNRSTSVLIEAYYKNSIEKFD